VTRDHAKRQEREALELFLARCDLGIAPTDIIDRERPDFELRFENGQRCGLEVARLVDGPLAAGMAGGLRLKRELLSRLAEDGLGVLAVLRVRDGFISLLNRSGVPQSHADGLNRLVRDHVEQERGDASYPRSALQEYGVEWVHKVTLRARDEPAVGIVSGVMGLGLEARTLSIVDAKNALLPVYRQNVPGDQWLLLVAGTQFAGGVDSESMRERLIRTDFDRVFYVDGYDGAAFELETVPTS
jgi:hypothetical protein